MNGPVVGRVEPEMSVDWDWSWLALRLAGHLGHAGVVSTVSTSSIRPPDLELLASRLEPGDWKVKPVYTACS